MEAIVCFYSVTDAISAEQLLLSAKFPVMVMPTPSQVRPGCGFCLRLPVENFPDALLILKNEVVLSGSYVHKTQNGTDIYQEWEDFLREK